MPLVWPVEHCRQFAEEARGLFAEQRRRDALGHTIHLVCAAVWCLLLSAPTTVSEISIVPLVLCFAVRMTGQYRVLIPLGWNRACWLTMTLAAWMGLSVFWSAEPARWVDDLGPMRYAVLLALLWPVLDRRRVLIAALVLGLVCGNLSQLAHALSVWTGHAGWTPWHRDAQRLSGWWDPVIAGSLLCAALGLHLGGALFGERNIRARALAGVMCVVTLGCIGITGTRGAWIGAAALVVVAALLKLVWMGSPRVDRTSGARVPRKNTARPQFHTVIVGLAVLVLGVNTLMLVPSVRERLIRGVQEIQLALSTHDYRSDTGARLLMWKEAVAAIGERPIGGVGAGGYHAWAVKHIREHGSEAEREAIEPAKHAHGETESPHDGGGIHRHAHSWLLHTGATTGLVGLVLTLAVIVCTFIGGSRRATGVSSIGAFVLERGYNLGPMLGAIGLVLAGLFDSIVVNQQTSAMWWTLAALCLTWRPSQAEDA